MSELWRELSWVLLVKALLLAVIWWLFFSGSEPAGGPFDRFAPVRSIPQQAPAGAIPGG